MNTQKILVYLRVHEVDLIVAAAIAIIGLLLSQYTKNMLLKAISHKSGDHTIKLFIINLLYLFILAVIAIMVLNKLGVPTTSLIAVLGASSLAIALSLQGSLSNIAAGVLLIFQKPFKIGDTVTIDSITGTIKLINIYNTIVISSANDYISFPNSKIISEKIINHTNHVKRKLIVPLYVSYKEDVTKVRDSLVDLFKDNKTVLNEPSTIVTINDLDTTGVQFYVNLWVKTTDYNAFKPEALRDIKILFDKHKITFATLNTTNN